MASRVPIQRASMLTPVSSSGVPVNWRGEVLTRRSGHLGEHVFEGGLVWSDEPLAGGDGCEGCQETFGHVSRGDG